MAQTSTSTVSAARRPGDRLAAKRSVDRSALAEQAIDVLLAQEAVAVGFMTPAPIRVPENRIPTDSATVRRIRRLLRISAR